LLGKGKKEEEKGKRGRIDLESFRLYLQSYSYVPIFTYRGPSKESGGGKEGQRKKKIKGREKRRKKGIFESVRRTLPLMPIHLESAAVVC